MLFSSSYAPIDPPCHGFTRVLYSRRPAAAKIKPRSLWDETPETSHLHSTPRWSHSCVLPEIALDHSKHGIPNLERQISQSPALFMQAVAWTYKRSDGGEDPHEWQIDDPEKRSDIAAATYRLLDKISRIPGTDAGDGTINVEALSKWLAEVRQLCAQHGRGKVGDHAIGQLLSKAPLGQDGVWPCEPVCEAFEKMASTDVADGFRMGVINARQARARRPLARRRG